MKVAFYYLHGRGGAFSNIQLLLGALARAYPDDQYYLIGMRGLSFGAAEGCANVRAVYLPVPFHLELARAWHGVIGLPHVLETLKPDVLWSLNLGAYRRLQVPSVLSVHNSHQVYPREFARLHPGSWLRVNALRFFFRRSLSASDAVLVQTALMGDYIRALRESPARIKVVPKAVETEDDIAMEELPAEVQSRMRAGKAERWFTFLYVSTFVPHKNHKLLLDVCGLLRSRKEVKARIVVTVSEEELRACGGESVFSFVREGYLVPLGWVGKKHLRALYDASDACLMPSLLESLSSAHLEAMHWGKPQISSDLPFARDLCGDAALFVHPHRAPDWVEAMEQVMSEPVCRERLIAAGHSRMSLFPRTWRDVACAIHQLLEEVAAARLPAGSSGRRQPLVGKELNARFTAPRHSRPATVLKSSRAQ